MQAKNNHKTGVRESGNAKALMLLTNAYDPDPRVRQEAVALIGMGCGIHLLAWDRDFKAPASDCMEGVEVERVYVASRHGRGASQLFFYALLYLKFLWRGWRISFDVVHCHDLDTLPIGFLLGKLKSKPVIYDAHESFPDMLAGNVHGCIRRLLTSLEDVLIRRTDLLITVGEKLRKHFESRGARRSVVVGNWKRLGEFARTPEQNVATRRRLQIPNDAMTAVCIGNLHHDRKLEELLDSVDASPDVYAIIGGDGPLRPLVEERAARNRRIIYLGFVLGRDVPEYTCAADVVYYGFDDSNPNARYSAPNKLFEALAAGRPLVTGDFGEIGDVVRHCSCGILLSSYNVYEVRNALAVLQDHDIRNNMGGNAKRIGETLMNWDHAEETLFTAYSSLLPGTLTVPLSVREKSPKGSQPPIGATA